ncbi:TetR/AcrR family transcriptional regulator [Aeromonas media]|uniref:TetR/AcrR family transcriptional regulator n=1 Tax=Aeromonas media TaxID=651 RepID=UPI002B4696D5|nr:TetR family transcriptional regulator [Aeromonas media]
MVKDMMTGGAVRLGGADTTKALILDVARRRFSATGYRTTSLRAIAKEVGVDPALLIRYFGSKEELFLEALAISDFCEKALTGPLDGMGHRIVLEMISGDIKNKMSSYVSLVQASDSETIRTRLQEVVRTRFIEMLAQRLPGQDAELRAHLISAQMGGLINSLAVIQHEMLLVTPFDMIARHYGAAIQLLIDGSPT